MIAAGSCQWTGVEYEHQLGGTTLPLNGREAQSCEIFRISLRLFALYSVPSISWVSRHPDRAKITGEPRQVAPLSMVMTAMIGFEIVRHHGLIRL